MEMKEGDAGDSWSEKMQKEFKIHEYKWSIDEFLHAEKHVIGDYTYINELESDDQI